MAACVQETDPRTRQVRFIISWESHLRFYHMVDMVGIVAGLILFGLYALVVVEFIPSEFRRGALNAIVCFALPFIALPVMGQRCFRTVWTRYVAARCPACGGPALLDYPEDWEMPRCVWYQCARCALVISTGKIARSHD